MNELELIVRPDFFPQWILYVLLGSISILAVLKYRHEVVFTHIKEGFFSAPTSTQLPAEELSFFGRTNGLLLINYILITGIASYMIMHYYHITEWIWLLLPISYHILLLLEVAFTGLLSGEYKITHLLFPLINYTAHLLGLILLPLLVVWLLNPHFSSYISTLISWLFIGMHLLRIVRSIITAIRHKILWYYIILYLCTFEIWLVIFIIWILNNNFIK